MNYRALAISIGVVCAVAILSGCEVDNSDLVQNSYTVEQHDEATGLTLLASSEMWINKEQVSALHKEMQACLGLSINPDTNKTVIAWRSFSKTSADWYGTQLGAPWGVHFVRDGVSNVYINTDLDKVPYINQGFDRNTYTDTQAVKHEFIHSILYHTTGSGNSSHSNDAYTRCDAWVNTYN